MVSKLKVCLTTHFSVLFNTDLVLFFETSARYFIKLNLYPAEANELNLRIEFCFPSQNLNLILRKLRLPPTLAEEISLKLILGITSLRRSLILIKTSDIFLLANFLRLVVFGLPKETIYPISILFMDIDGKFFFKPRWTKKKLVGSNLTER
jgi:hypothetical protein